MAASVSERIGLGGEPLRNSAFSEDEDEVAVFVVEAAGLGRVVAEVVAGEHLEGAVFPEEAFRV